MKKMYMLKAGAMMAQNRTEDAINVMMEGAQEFLDGIGKYIEDNVAPIDGPIAVIALRTQLKSLERLIGEEGLRAADELMKGIGVIDMSHFGT